jgi:transketolase
VLSNGHGSMLLYALLHLTGYELPMSELRNFRQLHSKTPATPRVASRPAWKPPPARWARASPTRWAWRWPRSCWRSEFNRDGHAVVDHHTYVFMGDGCLMEGISHEACALAGAWKLNKLIALYDDNGISIDGQVAPWFIDNTALRFAAYGWNVIGPVDGHDAAAVARPSPTPKTAPTSPR